MLWASTIAVGSEHGLRIRIYGDKGGLAWEQENPNHLKFSPLDRPTETLGRGSEGLSAEAARATRVSLGHPEGFFEAFANLYSDMADAVVARRAGTKASSLHLLLPTVEDGARGVKFVEAALESSAKNGAWVDATLAL
jgi:predicted dehydrogenase